GRALAEWRRRAAGTKRRGDNPPSATPGYLQLPSATFSYLQAHPPASHSLAVNNSPQTLSPPRGGISPPISDGCHAMVGGPGAKPYRPGPVGTRANTRGPLSAFSSLALAS